MQESFGRIWVLANLAMWCCVACQSDGGSAPGGQVAAGAAAAGAAGSAAAGSGAASGTTGGLAGAAGLGGLASAGRPAAAGSGEATAGRAAPTSPAADGGGGARPDTSAGAPAASAAGGSAASIPSAACDLPAEYTRANRVQLELTWPSTVGIEGGTGPLIAWSKLNYLRQPDGTTRIESHPCGTLTPTVTTTAVAGSLKSSSQVPLTAFDNPSMPTFQGTLTANGAMVVIDPGPSLIGATLSDPLGAWPMAADLMPFDHDGDGAPGITAIPLEGDGYLSPPTSVSQLEFIDRVYIASRVRFKVPLTRTDCSPSQQTSVDPISFDYTILGCHVKDRDECNVSETRFLSSQSPRFMLGKSGTWAEAEVPADASCGDVRTALPPP